MGGAVAPFRALMFITRSLAYFPPVCYEAQSLVDQGWQVRAIAISEREKQRGAPPPGVEVQEVPLLTRALPSGALMGAKYLELFVRQERAARSWPADLYIAHDLPALPQALVSARRRGAPVVYRAHELWTERKRVPGRALWRRIERRLARRADLVVAPTEARAAFLQQRLELPTAPLVVMNCPRLRSPQPGNRLAQMLRAAGVDAEGRRLVLYQGSVAASRCILELAAAAPRLPQDTLIVLLGPVDNRLRPQLERVLPHLRDRVVLLPPAPLEEVWPVLCSAQVGLALYRPDSVNNRLCAPNKVFEYMMAGLPIIGSDCEGMAALVRGNGIGVLVNPEEPEDIARGIRSVLEDPQQDAMRARGVELAMRTYNWEAQFARLQEAYRTLVDRARRDAAGAPG